MNEKINLFFLIDTISKKTQSDPRLVKKFITQLFKEIEKELVENSVAKIDHFGIFRIISSTDSNKILFLEKFNSAPVKKAIELDDDIPSEESLLEVKDEPAASTFITDDENKDSDPVLYGQKDEAAITSNSQQYSPPDTNSFKNIQVSQENIPGRSIFEDEDSDQNIFFNDYEEIQKKRKKSLNIRIVIISIIILIGIILFLFSFFQKKPESAPVDINTLLSVPAFVEVTNDDPNCSYILLTQSYVNLLSISQIYLGNEIFWPYIYSVNKDNITNPFRIESGVKIKIPVIDSTLIDINNKACVDSVKNLENNILIATNIITPRD